MAVLCDTAKVPALERADMWVSAISDFFVPLECTPHDRVGFYGRLRAGNVGPVQLCGLQVSPHTVERTPKLAANTPGDQYKLSLILGGEGLIVQDRREAVLRPGDFAVYDCSRPYTLVTNDPFRMLVCVLPRDIIGLSPERVAEITATRIPGDSGIAWALAPFIKRLGDLAIREDAQADEHRVVEGLVDLLESLLTNMLDGRSTPQAGSKVELVLRVRAYIDTHLGNPDLSPTQIAAAHFVSVRYLHKLFEAEGVSVSRWIRERRLDRCRRDLGDPARCDETVARIGMRWGFTDAAHLSRLFRDAYDCAPTDYRRLRLAG